MNATFKDRLLLFLDYLEIGQTKFEVKAGLVRGSVSKIKDGMSAPNLAKIANCYPQLSLDWLLTGRGKMLKQSSEGGIVLHNIGNGNIASAGSISNVKNIQNSDSEKIKELELLLLEKDAEIKSLKNTIEILIQSIKR